MILGALSTGVVEGWLKKSEFEDVIQRAYEALENSVWTNGMVEGICTSTDIESTLDVYERRPTDYFSSAPGKTLLLKITSLSSYNPKKV